MGGAFRCGAGGLPPCAPSDAGLCGHSASFPHRGHFQGRWEPRGRALLLLVVGRAGVVRGFLELGAGGMRGARWTGKAEQDPPPGRKVDVCRQPWATSCPWRRDFPLALWARFQGGARWGAPAGPGAEQLASPKGGGVGSLARGPLLSSGSGPCTWWPGAQGNRVLQGLECLGVCEAVAVALRVRGLRAETTLAGDRKCVHGHCTI